MLNHARAGKTGNAGFSLIELMVAMVLGLIVIGSVIALVLSMMRANNQTIASTRLTQELRALAALMSNDLRRAGGVIDPLTVATANAGNPNNPFAAITIPASPNNNCIQFGYANPAGEEALNFHTISLSGTEVRMATAQIAAPACGTGTRLSSPQVTITPVTGLTFERQSPCGTANPAGRCIRIILTGRLTGDAAITRRYTQDIYVRSI